jgi:phospholipid-binding lipoprotein MlaA
MTAGRSASLGRFLLLALLACTALVVTGCASMRSPAATDPQGAAENSDPFERVNRVVYTVNDRLDRAVFKPIAQGYEFVVPSVVRSCVSNVFGNVSDVPIAVNKLLQAKFRDASSDVCRVGVNTVIGVAGCFDVASKWGFEKHNEDFGQTLGRWGMPSGPFLVLPLFGPSTIRDGVALIGDTYLDPTHYVTYVAPRNITYGVRLVDKRAQALDTTNFIDNAALDPYVFVRDAWLARRRSLILDGQSPPPAQDTPGGDATTPVTGGPTAK